METYGTYNGIKFLMDGSMELSFLVPHHEKSHLLASIVKSRRRHADLRDYGKEETEKAFSGCQRLPLGCFARRLQNGCRTASSASARRRSTASISTLWGNMSRWHCAPMQWSGSAETWQKNGTGWLTEVVDSTLDGCKKVFAYYGSSTYDTKEMSRLIDSVIQDCMALQIETITPSELDMLLKEWGKSSAKQK